MYSKQRRVYYRMRRFYCENLLGDDVFHVGSKTNAFLCHWDNLNGALSTHETCVL